MFASVVLEVSIFVDKPGDGYECGICFNILNDPRQCSNGHCFCLTCISGVIAKRNKCPLCEEVFDAKKLIKCLALNNFILDMKTNCMSLSSFSGIDCCQWKGPLHSRLTHYECDCGFKMLQCGNVGCDAVIQRRGMPAHQMICRFRRYNCEFCSVINKQTYLADDLRAHTTSCSHRPTLCSNDCGVSVPFNQLQSHLMNDCALSMVECPLKGIEMCRSDCPGQLTRDTINSHVIRNIVEPFRLTTNNVADISERLKSLGPYVRKTLAPSVDALAARCSALEGESERQKQALKVQSVQITALSNQLIVCNDHITKHYLRISTLTEQHATTTDAITVTRSNVASLLTGENNADTATLAAQRHAETDEKLNAALHRIEALERLLCLKSEIKIDETNTITTSNSNISSGETKIDTVSSVAAVSLIQSPTNSEQLALLVDEAPRVTLSSDVFLFHLANDDATPKTIVRVTNTSPHKLAIALHISNTAWFSYIAKPLHQMLDVEQAVEFEVCLRPELCSQFMDQYSASGTQVDLSSEVIKVRSIVLTDAEHSKLIGKSHLPRRTELNKLFVKNESVVQEMPLKVLFKYAEIDPKTQGQLVISPSPVLEFLVAHDQPLNIFKITNISQQKLVFCFKTTNAEYYCVSPNYGVLNVGQSIEFTMSLTDTFLTSQLDRYNTTGAKQDMTLHKFYASSKVLSNAEYNRLRKLSLANLAEQCNAILHDTPTNEFNSLIKIVLKYSQSALSTTSQTEIDNRSKPQQPLSQSEQLAWISAQKVGTFIYSSRMLDYDVTITVVNATHSEINGTYKFSEYSGKLQGRFLKQNSVDGMEYFFLCTVDENHSFMWYICRKTEIDTLGHIGYFYTQGATSFILPPAENAVWRPLRPDESNSNLTPIVTMTGVPYNVAI